MSDRKFSLHNGAVVRMPEGIATEKSRHADKFRATPVIVRVIVRQDGARFAVPGKEQGRAMFLPRGIQPGGWIVIVACGPPIIARQATKAEIQRHLDQQQEPLKPTAIVPTTTGESTLVNTPRPNHG